MKKSAWLISVMAVYVLSLSAQQQVLPSKIRKEYSRYVTFLPADKLDSVWVYANTDLVPVVYKVNKYGLVPNAGLDSIVSVIHRIRYDTRVNLAYVWIGGSASPEGPVRWNRTLGARRSQALADYLTSEADVPAGLLRVENLEEDWYSVQRALQQTDFPYRDEIVRIISTESDWEKRKQRIRALDKGKTWRRLVREVFPPFRNARMVIVCYAEPVGVSGMQAQPPADTRTVAVPVLPQKMPVDYRRPVRYVIAVKSNLLAVGAALVANLGFEVSLAEHWSLDVPFYYSPYNLFKDTRKMRIMAVQPEVRYWFGRVSERHFVGLHTHVAGFNIALNDHGRYQDPNHALWGMGLSYGYAIPFGRNDRWGVEFTLGLGFADYKYDRYENNGTDWGELIHSSGNKRYWGVTRAGITLSYKWFKERRTRR